jgi:uncharacterized delta-60 repeat protein
MDGASPVSAAVRLCLVSRPLWPATALLLALATWCPTALANPGDLDPSFGTGGRAVVQLSDDADAPMSEATRVIADGDGVLVAAQSRHAGELRAVVARFVGDHLDTTWGDQGTIDFSGPAGVKARIDGLARRGDGETAVLVATDAPSARIVLLDAHGAPDPAFGSAGQLVVDDDGAGLAAAPGDGLVVTRSVQALGENPQLGFTLIDATGTIQRTSAPTAIEPAARRPLGDAVVDALGRVLIGGVNDTTGDPWVARFALGPSATYVPDATFGDAGVAELASPRGMPFGARRLVPLADGRLLVAANGGGGNTVMRLTDAGALDSTFGTGGVARARDLGNGGGEGADAVLLQSDGRIVMGGASGIDQGFTLSRFTADGQVDTGYGDGGTAHLDAPVDGTGDTGVVATGLALLADDTPVLVGTYSRRVHSPSPVGYDSWDPEAVGVLHALTGDAPADTTAPAVTVDRTPADPEHAPRPDFGFHSDPYTVLECRIDGGAWTVCYTDPSWGTHELNYLANGPHTLEIRATDQAGNLGAPATISWTNAIPDPQIISGPDGLTGDPRPQFGLQSPDPNGTLMCALDGVEHVCSGLAPDDSFGLLADGPHTYTARIEIAGTGVATRHFIVDTTAPKTAITVTPADGTRNRRPAVAFSVADANVDGLRSECAQDGGAFAACTSPWRPASDLGDGEHRVTVRSIDAVGNAEPTGAAATFRVGPAPAPAGPAAVTPATADPPAAAPATPSVAAVVQGTATVASRPCTTPPPHALDVRPDGTLVLTLTIPRRGRLSVRIYLPRLRGATPAPLLASATRTVRRAGRVVVTLRRTMLSRALARQLPHGTTAPITLRTTLTTPRRAPLRRTATAKLATPPCA